MEEIKDKNKRLIGFLEDIMYKKTEDDTKETDMPEYQHNFNNWMRNLIKEIKEGKIQWRNQKKKRN